MRFITVMIILLLCGANVYSANQIKSNIYDDQPVWVQEMYSANADPGKVLKLYDEYYKTHEFQKNGHTQYLKRWLRDMSRTQIPKAPEQYQKYLKSQRDYITRSMAARNSKRPGLQGDYGQWTCLGPFDFDKEAAGRSYAPGAAHCYSIAQAKSNTDLLYCGAATAGLWKSTDKGNSWKLITRDLLINEVYAVEIDHSNPDIIYFGGAGKLYKSTDGGQTINVIGDEAFNAVTRHIKDIVMHPTNTNILLIATEDGLWRSEDAGDNWALVDNKLYHEIEFKPGNPDVVYAVRLSGSVTHFMKSIDGGVTFNMIDGNWPKGDMNSEQKRTEIATTPAAPDNVYALLTGKVNGGDGLYGIYVSTDSGENWEFRCCGEQPGGPASEENINMMGWSDQGTDDGGQKYYDLALEVDDYDPNLIHVGAVNHWVSTDGGYTFTCPAQWSHPAKKEYVHADIHDIQQYGDDLWFACDGGIFYSNTGGDSVYKRMNGIAGTDFWGFGAGFWDGGVMLGGTYHNGTLLKDNDVYLDGWICTQGGDNYRGFVNYGNERMVYHDGGGKILPGDRNVAIGSFPFTRQPNASYIIGLSSDIRFDPRCYNIVYSGYETGLWKSTNNGASFSKVHEFAAFVTSIEQAWGNPDYIYVCTYKTMWEEKKLWRTTDGGNSWTDITPDSLITTAQWVAFDVAVSSSDEKIIWLARTSQVANSPTALNGHQIFRSTDAGNTWENYSTDALDGEFPTNIVHQLGTEDGIWMGTRRAVYYRSSSTEDWVLHNEGMPLSTTSIQLQPFYRERKIRNGTNRSVYEADFIENSATVAQIAANKLQSYCVRDTVYYTDHSIMTDENASWHWEFEGATPAQSDLRQPKVTYAEPGIYGVTLSISDAYGSDTQTYDNFIEIKNECSPDSKAGNALLMEEVGDYATAQGVNLKSNNLTISAWIKPDGPQPDYSGIVMTKAQGHVAGLNFRPDNKLAYHWPNGQWWWESNLTVPEGRWSHVALIVSPDSISVVLNGVMSTHVITPDTMDFSRSLYIGAYPEWKERNFKGILDEVCIWNRALSLDELKLNMHLTKKPDADNSIVAYYQFNRSEGTVTDRVGTAHAGPAGAARRVASTAPLGGGTSQVKSISSIGAHEYDEAGFRIVFADGATLPMGNVVVSRIENKPDYVPEGNNCTSAYWVLNNYGANTEVRNISSLSFLGNTEASKDGYPDRFRLMSRAYYEDGDTWQELDAADAANDVVDIDFADLSQLRELGQFMILDEGDTTSVDDDKIISTDIIVRAYPNPAGDKRELNIYTNISGQLLVSLTDINGRIALRTSINGSGQIDLGGLAAGTYYLQVRSEDYISNEVIIIE